MQFAMEFRRSRYVNNDWRTSSIELEDSFLFLENIVKDDYTTAYVFKWFIPNHCVIPTRTTYNCHYIRIGKTLHRLCILKLNTNTRDSIRKQLVYRLALEPLPTVTRVSFTILQAKREIQAESDLEETLRYDNNPKYYWDFLGSNISELLDLTALCKITVHVDNEISVGIEKDMAILADFERLYDGGLYSDMTVFVGKKRFAAHRAILAARSPVFADMIQNRLENHHENKLVIEDSDEGAFDELLRFLYTGKTGPLKTELALNLFPLAKRYEVPALKIMVTDYLRCNISNENVLRILTMADRYKEDDLVQKADLIHEAIKFIGECLPKMISTAEWKTFRTQLDLVDHILQYMYSLSSFNG